jgi:hypothetical protein
MNRTNMNNNNLFRVEEKSSVENGVLESKQLLVSESESGSEIQRWTLWHGTECYGFVLGTWQTAVERAAAALDHVTLTIRPSDPFAL